MLFNLNIPGDKPSHLCESVSRGDIVTFHCPRCGYQLTMNWRTGETHVLVDGDTSVYHHGEFVAPLYAEALRCQN